jgi:peptidoglycan/xylan/chitin deacetylase (PgdA/CDA1 family)
MYIVTLTRQQIMRRLAYVAGLILLAAVTLYGGEAVRTAVAPAGDKPLTRAASPDDRVALTFDVTWGTGELGKITSILEANDVKATFFVGGTFLSLHGDAVRQLGAKGHEVGTLGQKIIDLSAVPEQEVTSNLLASQSALAKLLGGPVRYFRPPQGPATPSVVAAAKAANLVTVTYSLDSLDHHGEKADAIVKRVVKQAGRGEIILLSASDWSPETARALPQIIKGLKERGIKLVPIGQLVPQDMLNS